MQSGRAAGTLDGVPSIRGLRIPVATVVGMVADAMTMAEILRALEAEDVDEASGTRWRRYGSASFNNLAAVKRISAQGNVVVFEPDRIGARRLPFNP